MLTRRPRRTPVPNLMPTPDPTPRRRPRRLLRRCLLLFVVGVMASGLLEGALRLGWIPNALHERNSRGPTVEDPRRTVLILGDSFIVPRGMLGRILAERWAEDGVAVENLAHSGTGPFEYVSELERSIAEVEPDVVLLSYYVGNDLTDVQNHPSWKAPAGGGRRAVAIDRTSGLPVLRDLYAFHYLRARVGRWLAGNLDEEAMREAGVSPELIRDARESAINPYLIQLAIHDPRHFLDNVLVDREESREAWEQVRVLLDDVLETCRAHGAQLKIVAHPHSIQVSRQHFGLLSAMTFEMSEETLGSSRAQELLADHCRSRDIPLLDLLPVLRSAPGGPFYLEKDDHMNAAGNELAAEHVTRFLWPE